LHSHAQTYWKYLITIFERDHGLDNVSICLIGRILGKMLFCPFRVACGSGYAFSASHKPAEPNAAFLGFEVCV